MKAWEFIEISDGVGVGSTEDGFEYLEIDIEAWNDDEGFTDLEKIALVRATETEETILFSAYVKDESLLEDERVTRLMEEATKQLEEEVKAHF